MITKVSVIHKVQTVKTASTTLGGTLAAVSLSFACSKVFVDKTGSEIALSWSPMRLEIQSWRPEFHSWSPASDL